MSTTLARLRLTGALEALSFLLLLGFAMPLKYIWDQPQWVSTIGMAHGVLWIAYIALAVAGQLEYRWPPRTTLLLGIASLLPFGPFVADARLLRPIQRSSPQAIPVETKSQQGQEHH